MRVLNPYYVSSTPGWFVLNADSVFIQFKFYIIDTRRIVNPIYGHAYQMWSHIQTQDGGWLLSAARSHIKISCIYSYNGVYLGHTD